MLALTRLQLAEFLLKHHPDKKSEGLVSFQPHHSRAPRHEDAALLRTRVEKQGDSRGVGTRQMSKREITDFH